MHQIKLFRGLESDIAAVESEVNSWLSSNKVKVVQVFGNVAPQTPRLDGTSGHLLGPERNARGFAASDILITVVYEK